MRRFEMVEGSSSKFWEIELGDVSFEARWGRIGTSGQSQTKTFANAAKARAEHDKLIKDKTGKGYVEVGASAGASEGSAPEASASKSAPPAPAPSKPPKPAKAAKTAPPAAPEEGLSVAVEAPAPPKPKAASAGELVLTDPRTWPKKQREELLPRPGWGLEVPVLDRLSIWKALRKAGAAQAGAVKAYLEGEAPEAPAALDLEVQLAKSLCDIGDPWRHQKEISSATSLLIDHWWVTGGPAHALRMLAALLEAQPRLVQYGMPGLRLALLLTSISAEERKELAALPITDAKGFSGVRQILFPELGEGDQAVLGGAKRREPFAAITTLAAVQAACSQAYPYYYLKSGDSHRSASTLPTLYTWLAAIGEPALEPISRLLDADGDTDAKREVAEVVAFVASPQAFEILGSRSGDRVVLGALRDAALAHPSLALPILVQQATQRTQGGASAKTILAQLLRAADAELEGAIATLGESGRKLVAEMRLQSSARAEAELESLPPLLVSPPWLTKKKRESVSTVELSALPFEETMVWPSGLRARWAARGNPEIGARFVAMPDHYQRRWGIPRELAEKLGETEDPADLASLRDHAQLQMKRWFRPYGATLLATAPRLVAKLITVYASAAWYAEEDAFARLAADHELLFLDPFLAFGESHPAEALEVLRPYRSPRVAFLAADALHRLKKKPPGAAAWLRAHPEAAAVGLLPIALGKPSKARDAAEHGLRFLAQEGQEAVVMAVAERYGAVAKVATRAVLDFDPLDLYPSKIPALPEFVNVEVLPRLVLEESGEALPVSAMKHVLTMLQFSKLDVPYAGIAVLKQLTTVASRDAFVWELFSTWNVAGAPSKEGWAFAAMGLLGGDECARRITPLIRAWPGESQHQRAVTGLDVLALIGTDVALMHLHGIAQKLKFKGLQEKARQKIDELAEARGLTADELADRLVPDLGLDDDGSLNLDFGPRSFRVIFDESLRPLVRDGDGKRLGDLPKPRKDDDAEKSSAAVELWKALKKDVKTIALGQVLRLELAMCGRRRWTLPVFQQFLVKHPLMRHLVVRLSWGVYDGEDRVQQVFRVVEDGTFADANDDAIVLPDGARIGVSHTMEMSSEDEAKLGTIFGDYEVVQPFKQLGRETYALTEDERTQGIVARWKGKKVPTGKVLGLEARGWRRGAPQDGGHISWMEKAIDEDVVSLNLDPGIAVGDVTMFPEQSIESLVRGDDFQPKKGAEGLPALHPIVLSELIRDIEGIFG